MFRLLAVASLVLAVPIPALATRPAPDVPPPIASVLPDGPPRPYREPGLGIRFRPGPASIGHVSFTPGRRPTALAGRPSAPAPRANEAATPSPTSTRAPAPTAQRRSTDSPPAAAIPSTRPAAAATPIAIEPAPPPAQPASSSAREEAPQASAHAVAVLRPAPDAHERQCRLAGEVQRTALDSGELRAVQIALATRGDDAVALVIMGRSPPPRQIREGMVFPESRLIRLGEHGEPSVQHTPGFEPDAALALDEHGEVAVVSYSRLDVHGDVLSSRPTIRMSMLDGEGHLVGPTQALEGSAGLRIDSPVVSMREGFAVVMGRETAADDGTRGPVHESLFTYGSRDGWHAPLMITDAQGDDSIGRFRVGLHAVDEGRALVASWTVAAGHDAGVWTRSIRNDSLDTAHRRVARAAWGSEIADDGGVLFRSGGERSAPVQLFYSPVGGGSAVALGAGWDPSIAWIDGRLLVAGATLADGRGGDFNALIAEAGPGEPLAALEAPQGTGDALASAVDYDLAATAHGAVLAWIESDGEQATAARRVAVARIRCP